MKKIQITRRNFLLGLSLLGVMPYQMSWANQPQKHYRILMLLYRGMTDAEHGFMDYLKNRGLQIEFIIRDFNENLSLLNDLHREIAQLKPDLIYTFGTTLTVAVAGRETEVNKQQHIVDIPIVFSVVADPQGAGLVSSLASSGRLLTGVSHLVPMSVQWRSLQALGKVKRIATIHTPNEANAVLAIQKLQELAKQDQVFIHSEQVKLDGFSRPMVSSIAEAMQKLLMTQPDWIYLPSDSFLIQHAGEVVQYALKANVPVFSGTEQPIRQHGALAGIVGTYYAVGAFAGYKAEQILVQKKDPATLPMESLNRFTFLVNMNTARKLKRYPPVSVFRFAEVIDG